MEPPSVFEFPFKPYSIQHEFMTNLYKALEHGKLGIFESPTGTGKSLSIICGAVRWLKDCHSNERINLLKRIKDLKENKEKITSSSSDWISTQSKEIELTREISVLTLEHNKLLEYDKKLENLLKRKTKIMPVYKGAKPEDEQVEEEQFKEDDFLLDELKIDTDSDPEEGEDNKYEPTKVFICSRTHSQLTQFVGEIMKSPFQKNVRVASLASRQVYCINSNVSRLKNVALINDRCLDMQNKIEKTATDGKVIKKQKGQSCKCPYYKQQAIDELRTKVLTEVLDVEDLVKMGKKMKACPYYASRLAVEDAEIVLVPYNTILHKATRQANGIKLANNVLIIDEAHNLLEAMAQMHNTEINYQQIQQCLQQLKCYKQRFNSRFSAKTLLHVNQLIFVITKLQKFLDKQTESKENIFTIENFVHSVEIDNYNMFKLVNFCKESRIAQKVWIILGVPTSNQLFEKKFLPLVLYGSLKRKHIRNYSIKYPDDNLKQKPIIKQGVRHFLDTIENKQQNVVELIEDVKNEPIFTNTLLSIVAFLQSLTYSYDDGRILLSSHTDKRLSRLKFVLLNSSTNFRDIVKETRSIIVAGGTMKPNTEFRERLFINAGADSRRIVEFSCDHIIPPENILPIIISKGQNQENLLFSYEHRMSMGSCVKNIIEECCKKVPGGIVVFFPSYSYESWIWNQIKDINFGRPIFREPHDSTSVEIVLKKYAEAIGKRDNIGALLLSVVGGKLSEGLNFNDDLGRCIIVIGLPYANISAPDLKEKMAYLDKNEGIGSGRQFYEGMCMKAVNQSIGRAVRHKNDYATILLVDERYNRTATKNALPDWIKKSLKVCDFTEAFSAIEKFFENKKN